MAVRGLRRQTGRRQIVLQGVIFDMDGVLVDTEPIWDSIWPACFEQMGLPLPPESFYTGGRGMSGETYANYVQGFYPQVDAKELVALFMKLGEERFALGVPVKPGARELLDYLKGQGVPCAVASSSLRSIIECNLRSTGLAGYFDVIVSGQDVTFTKPDPTIFLLAAERLGVDIRRCLVLEDSLNGVRAGHAAGAVTVMVPDLIPPNDEIAQIYDGCCTDLLEVKSLLEQGRL